jgi:hypothetical protein
MDKVKMDQNAMLDCYALKPLLEPQKPQRRRVIDLAESDDEVGASTFLRALADGD